MKADKAMEPRDNGSAPVEFENQNSVPVDWSRSRWVKFFARLTLIYPLFPILALYGEWVLAWSILGHPPRYMADDPKYIDGSSWMHPAFALAMMGYGPAVMAGLPLNTLYLSYKKRPWQYTAARIALFVFLWLGSFALLAWDPGDVINWWLD